jgi:hypothetical protein
MAIYTMADRTSNITTGAACFEIRTAATQRAIIKAIKISLVTGAATVIGVGRPAAIGVTPTSPKTVLPYDNNAPTGNTTTAVAWATGPTVPANYLDRFSFPATIGSGIMMPYEYRDTNGIIIPVSGSLVIWNILGGATLDIGIVIDE